MSIVHTFFGESLIPTCVPLSNITEACRCNAAQEIVSERPTSLPKSLQNLSYASQYDIIFSQTIDAKKPVPKPNRSANALEPDAKEVPFTTNIWATEKSAAVPRPKNTTDKIYIGFMAAMHILCLAVPMTFSWTNVALFGVTYFITGCLGITLSYHRQLSHKSFVTPKWLEYVLAYCGALAVQGDPKEWVSTHRYGHHASVYKFSIKTSWVDIWRVPFALAGFEQN